MPEEARQAGPRLRATSDSSADEEPRQDRLSALQRRERERERRQVTAASNLCINTSMCKYNMVRLSADLNDWDEAETDAADPAGGRWHIFWTDMSVSHARVRALLPLQKLNHFADMTSICHKASAAVYLKRMAKVFDVEYRFFPTSWTLPKEVAALHRHMAPNGRDGGGPATPIILKPNKGAQGADITLVRTVEQLDSARAELAELGSLSCVAQEYIDRPLLLDGFKFDLRLYVLVTSCSPLRLHLFRDGIARLCTEKYHPAAAAPAAAPASDPPSAAPAAAPAAAPSMSAADWRFRHLTNYAINRNHPSFSAGEGSSGGGQKRRLGAVFDALRAAGLDVDMVWGEIHQLVVKTLIAVQPVLGHAYSACRPISTDAHPFSCFELLGIDLLLDDSGKPWLVECNHSPSLGCDTQIDTDLKRTLLTHTMRLVSFSAAEAALLRKRFGEKAEAKPVASANAPPARRRSRSRSGESADGGAGSGAQCKEEGRQACRQATNHARAAAPPASEAAAKGAAAKGAAAPPAAKGGSAGATRRDAATGGTGAAPAAAAPAASAEKGAGGAKPHPGATRRLGSSAGGLGVGALGASRPGSRPRGPGSARSLRQYGSGSGLGLGLGGSGRTGSAALLGARVSQSLGSSYSMTGPVAHALAGRPPRHALVGDAAYKQQLVQQGLQERRLQSETLATDLSDLRVEYEAANSEAFDLVHPPPDNPRLQSLYELLLNTAERAFAEDSRGVPPPLLPPGAASDWASMFKLVRTGERICMAPATAPTEAERCARAAARAPRRGGGEAGPE